MQLNLRLTAAQNEIFYENPGRKFKIVPKGRRLGLTRGAASYFIECMAIDKIPYLLWGDTIFSNIKRYIQRYWAPVLKENGIAWEWDKSSNMITIGDSVCDFRSADNPENWEGFGYKKIFLNEAGIILKNRSLYETSVLPMMIDNQDSQLIAGGTPKGRTGKYHELYTDALIKPDYWAKTYTTYDNPFLTIQSIETLMSEIPPFLREQEIYGKFIDAEDTIFKREWLEGRYTDDVPGSLDVFMGVDLAISQKQTADYTTIAVIGIADNGNIYVLDVNRAKITFHEQQQLIKTYADKWQPKLIGIEEVQYQAAIVQELLRTTKLPVKGIKPKPKEDKVTRVTPLLLRYEKGLVYHVRGLRPEFEEELFSFPTGDHDDMVDALAYAYIIATKKKSIARL